jgi:hypothetical protein
MTETTETTRIHPAICLLITLSPLQFSHPIGEFISRDTIVGFVRIDDFLRIVREDIADLHLRVAISALRPDSRLGIERKSEKVQCSREKCHLRDLEEGDHHPDDRKWSPEPDACECPDTGLTKLEDTITDTSPDHHDHELTERESCDDDILIFYLYRDLILHRTV